jgi:trans-2,3-dihydro-3-hydroxyanthranilate isomerase
VAVPLAYRIVDVFTDRAFAGNPLAVVLDADDLPGSAMQALAREFNLSETVFPLAPEAVGADYRVRIFTPAVELPFAGHPSVGAAWVLASLGRLSPGRVVQECGAGLLPLTVEPGPGRVELAGGTPHVGDALEAEPLLRAVGLGAGDAAAGIAPRVAGCGIDFAYLPVRADAVARARPDPAALLALDPAAAWAGVSVVAYDGEHATAHCRVFPAGVGVGEDPATGSAALGLGAFLGASGLVEPDGETDYLVVQGFEIGRPSTMECAVVLAGGQAVQCRVAGSVVPVAAGEVARPD